MDPLLIAGILLALTFNFVNGLNDASHSVATVVATRALSPGRAIISTALCNLIGPFVFTTAIAVTIGTTLLHPDLITPPIIIVALLTAIVLVLPATRFGIPVSSSHALVGGLLGAGIAADGLRAMILPAIGTVELVIISSIIGGIIGALVLTAIMASLGEDMRFAFLPGAASGIALTIITLIVTGTLQLSGILGIVIFIFISPILGFLAAFTFEIIISHLFRYSRQNQLTRIFQPLHVAASLFQALGHGANDGQHAVGIITALLVADDVLSAFIVPPWVILASALAIAVGTGFGGWQVVDKMAKQITRIRPYQGFAAAISGGAVLAMVTTHGIPVSSTHVISGAIVGVGATRGEKAVQWDVVRQMMAAWVLTIPLALVVSYAGYLLLSAIMPLFI